MVPGAAGETVILQSSGEKVTIDTADIADTRTSKVSAMPAGLLNKLEQQEIADLFELLRSSPTEAITRRPNEGGVK